MIFFFWSSKTYISNLYTLYTGTNILTSARLLVCFMTLGPFTASFSVLCWEFHRITQSSFINWVSLCLTSGSNDSQLSWNAHVQAAAQYIYTECGRGDIPMKLYSLSVGSFIIINHEWVYRHWHKKHIHFYLRDRRNPLWKLPIKNRNKKFQSRTSYYKINTIKPTQRKWLLPSIDENLQKWCKQSME